MPWKNCSATKYEVTKYHHEAYKTSSEKKCGEPISCFLYHVFCDYYPKHLLRHTAHFYLRKDKFVILEHNERCTLCGQQKPAEAQLKVDGKYTEYFCDVCAIEVASCLMGRFLEMV